MKLTMDLECVPNLSCGLDWLEIFDEMSHGPGGIAKLATWLNVYIEISGLDLNLIGILMKLITDLE